MSPDESLCRLIDGNKRFASGYRSVESLASGLRFKELAKEGQRPFAMVLTCSDARVPAETVFDQGLGDLFVIRVAGNIVLPSIVASVEFAAMSFQTPLCVVMGHTGCGAISSAVDFVQGRLKLQSECIISLMEEMKPAVEIDVDKKQVITQKDIDAIATQNVYHSMSRLLAMSPVIKDYVAAGKLAVVGALYDIHTGQVSFFTE